jgi:hypothetical protein
VLFSQPGSGDMTRAGARERWRWALGLSSWTAAASDSRTDFEARLGYPRSNASDSPRSHARAQRDLAHRESSALADLAEKTPTGRFAKCRSLASRRVLTQRDPVTASMPGGQTEPAVCVRRTGQVRSRPARDMTSSNQESR